MDTDQVLTLRSLTLNDRNVEFGIATIELRSHGATKRWSGMVMGSSLHDREWSGEVCKLAGETDDGRRVAGSALLWLEDTRYGEFRLRGTDPLQLGLEEW